jgi:hypothetical protein
LYSILSDFEILRKLVGLIKVCLNETYSRVRIGKSLSDKFTIENIWTKEELSNSRMEEVAQWGAS